MANNAPVEILTEILRPLLKHSDAAFSDTSEKTSSGRWRLRGLFLPPRQQSLAAVVILRTTAQAVALERVLKRYPDMGNYILKLRVEGGFGTAMHTILKCATRLRELFISLVISASDNVKGLCSGLPHVNPHSVYLYDRNYNRLGNGFSKNKKVDELFQTVVSLIPNWNNLKVFDFPYFPQDELLISNVGSRVLDARTERLVSALASSQTLETVLLYTGVSVPAYLSQFISIPTLKTLQFRSLRTIPMSNTFQPRPVPVYSRFRKEIEAHPEYSLYAEFPLPEIDVPTKTGSDRGNQDSDFEDVVLLSDFGTNSDDSDDDHSPPPFVKISFPRRDRAVHESDSTQSKVTERKLGLIQDLGKRRGNTITSLIAGGFEPPWNNNRAKPEKLKPLSLTIFADFTALTKLTLHGGDYDPGLTKPSDEFCKTVFPKLESLDLSWATPQMVDLFAALSLPALHTVKGAVSIGFGKAHPDAITWNAFLTLHGSKIRTLDTLPYTGASRVAQLRVQDMSAVEKAQRTQLRIFELCPNLCDVSFRVVTSAPQEGAVVAPEKPHNSLTQMNFDAIQLTKKEEAALRTFFLGLFTGNGDIDSETIENNMFPALREVKFTPIQWPTSESAAAKTPLDDLGGEDGESGGRCC
ncbi:hypothetical protein C8F01DRAFT_1237238 [Mycena amicta]|nr:hypothetical protein C8F01DRAFT_1237238 [Mycena amicta]